MKNMRLGVCAWLSLSVAWGAPQITGVVNGASFAGGPAPASVASIFGTGLAAAVAGATTLPLPISLGGVTVTINGTTVPLWYVSPTQINFEMPAEAAAGPATAVVNSSGAASAPFSFTAALAAPGIFTYGGNRAVATNPDNSLTDAGHPAAAGSVITVYLVGIGPLDHPVPTGAQAPSQPLSRPTLAASATIGGQNAPIQFLGLTPGAIALAQANLTVPNLAGGDYPVVITIGGVASNAPLITVGGGGGGAAGSLTTLGSLALPGLLHFSNVLVNGNTAYVCATDAIHVVDVSNPSSPKLLSSFGQADLGTSGVGCVMYQNNLLAIVNTQAFYTYSLANPTQPQPVGGRVTPQFPFTGSAFFVGSTGFFTTDTFSFFGSTIASQHGEFYAYDFSNPAQPRFLSSLQPDPLQPASSDLSPRFASIAADDQTAYVGGTTSTGGDPNGGSAVLQVMDISNPQNLRALTQVLIPQATIATGIAIQGNLALVVGNTKSWRNPGTPNFDFTGVETLTAFDITDHRNPVPMSTMVSSYLSNFNVGAVVAPLGNGLFMLSIPPPADSSPSGESTGSGQLAVVDATNPGNLKLTPLLSVPRQGLIAVAGNTLYALTATGLNIYRIGP